VGKGAPDAIISPGRASAALVGLTAPGQPPILPAAAWWPQGRGETTSRPSSQLCCILPMSPCHRAHAPPVYLHLCTGAPLRFAPLHHPPRSAALAAILWASEPLAPPPVPVSPYPRVPSRLRRAHLCTFAQELRSDLHLCTIHRCPRSHSPSLWASEPLVNRASEPLGLPRAPCGSAAPTFAPLHRSSAPLCTFAPSAAAPSRPLCRRAQLLASSPLFVFSVQAGRKACGKGSAPVTRDQGSLPSG